MLTHEAPLTPAEEARGQAVAASFRLLRDLERPTLDLEQIWTDLQTIQVTLTALDPD